MRDKVKCRDCAYCKYDAVNPSRLGICARTIDMPVVRFNSEKHCDYFVGGEFSLNV